MKTLAVIIGGFIPALALGNPNLYANAVPLNPNLHAWFLDNGVPQPLECGWVKTLTTQQAKCDLAYIIGGGSHTFTMLYRQDAGCTPTTCYVSGESAASAPFTQTFSGPPASPSGLSVAD